MGIVINVATKENGFWDASVNARELKTIVVADRILIGKNWIKKYL